MRINKIKAIRTALMNNQVSLGAWQQIPHASISEILGKAGFDWVAVDLEHGSISIDQLPDLFRAIELGNTLPIARIASATARDCKQALDAGAGGVIVPMIESAEQLNAVRNACCWPPSGNRGVGFSRANLFGKFFKEYYEEAKSPLLIAQIEHYTALKNLNEILSVKGLDAIMVGPYDLSASLNIPGDFKNKIFINAIDSILNTCNKKNIPAGIHVVIPKIKDYEEKIKKGFKFIAYSTDGVILHQYYSKKSLMKKKDITKRL